MNSSCCIYEEPILNQVLPPILVLEFLFGMIGNLLALRMIFREVKTWKPNSVYLLSLTIADFVVLCCVIFRADYYIRQLNWLYGDIPCRLLLYVLAVARAAGMIFLSVIALNRYCKIIFPFHKVNNITLKQAGCICILLWVFLLAMHSYILTGPHTYILQNITQCESFTICPSSQTAWQDAFYIALSSMSLLIISYCTIHIAIHLKDNAMDTNGKVGRAMRFLTMIATIFFICYLPSASVRVAIWVLKAMQYMDCVYYANANRAFYITICFTYFYSMLNPILYYFSSPSSSSALPKFCKKTS